MALPCVQRSCPLRVCLKFIWFAQQSGEEAQKYIKITAKVFRRLCFNVRQGHFSVLHAESGGWTMQVRVDKFKEFSGMEWLGECADGAESFRFVENLRATVRGNEKNRDLRLKVAQI